MAPASNEEQFKFLISCIRYSNNGKVDFGQVAKECKIVSKGAAAKRYERMMRAHGIAPNAASIKPAPQKALKTESNSFSLSNINQSSRTPSSSISSSKKRKTDAFLEDQATCDDDEGFGSETNRIKSEPGYGRDIGKGKGKFKEEIKEVWKGRLGTMETKMQMQQQLQQHTEAMGRLSVDEAANLMRYYDSPTTYHGLGLDDGTDVIMSHGNAVEEMYSSSDFGEGAGYGGPMAGTRTYGLCSQHPSYDYSASYGGGCGATGMSMSSLNRSESIGKGMHYWPAIQTQYSGDLGRSDSPVILE